MLFPLAPIFFFLYIHHINVYKVKRAGGGEGGWTIRGDKNTMRYIIGDIEGPFFKKLIFFMHNKLRTPKNITFNNLIQFMNSKYSLNKETSVLDTSYLSNNSWLAGFTDSDGYFGVKTAGSLVLNLNLKHVKDLLVLALTLCLN